MFDTAQPAGMPVDRDVVGRIGEDQAGLLARHQGGEHGRVAHIATDQSVRPELPDLARADPGRGGVREGVVGRIIRLLGGDGRQEVVDLRNREARDVEVELEIRGQERPQLRGEQVLVPAGIERQFVVSEDIGALLGPAQVLDLQTGHLGQAEECRCGHAPVTGQDGPRLVDQHRRGEAELPDAGGDLPDLLRGMGAGIACPRGEGRQGRCVICGAGIRGSHVAQCQAFRPRASSGQRPFPENASRSRRSLSSRPISIRSRW